MGLWGGRFSEPTDDDLRRLNDSLPYDQRMALQDVRGSIAYAQALGDAAVISPDDAEVLLDGLHQIQAEFEAGTFTFAPGDEDIHTAVERRLTELVGPVGGKLHTGRSRNDQVATDFRLWVMDALRDLDGMLAQVQIAIIERSREHTGTVMPGYTHLQPAQPITAAHWLMSFFWMLARDRGRLRDALPRMSVMPLGSGALAGTPFPVDRAVLAERLGFASYSQNSLDGVSDRDFAVEWLFCTALIGAHLSRLAEDIILYSNPTFGFVSLSDRYSTGSSLMPQKRNADPMELTRGKVGRLVGYLTGLLTTLKGLPSGYNKDLQEDKEAVFGAYDTLGHLLPVITGVLSTLTFNPERMRAALTEDMLATDLADYLVKCGMPFREAHHVVGRVVQHAAAAERQLSELTTAELQSFSALFEDDAVGVFDFDRSVQARNTPGGVGAVPEQIAQADVWLKQFTID